MIYTEYIKIAHSVVHIVGNKSLDEGLFLSDEPLTLDDETGGVLLKYLLSPFKTEAYYQFWHETNIELNEVYSFAKNVFSNIDSFHEMGKAIARHLYANSLHPKIKNGELCIVLLKNVIVETTTCNALGIFKSENKDTFLKVKTERGRTTMQSETGINVNHLDKGCIIFDTKQESGYLVSVVDNTNKGSDAKYWTDDFLKVRLVSNGYNQTDSLLTITKEFIAQLPCVDSKIEKANYYNRYIEAIKSDSIKVDEYAHAIFQDAKTESMFSDYKQKRQSEIGVSIEKEFEVSALAIKKKSVTGSMTTIKLDKNFDVNIHCGEQFIERGYDEEKGMRYYKLYFNEEK